jgi:hypothetical protein
LRAAAEDGLYALGDALCHGARVIKTALARGGTDLEISAVLDPIDPRGRFHLDLAPELAERASRKISSAAEQDAGGGPEVQVTIVQVAQRRIVEVPSRQHTFGSGVLDSQALEFKCQDRLEAGETRHSRLKLPFLA